MVIGLEAVPVAPEHPGKLLDKVNEIEKVPEEEKTTGAGTLAVLVCPFPKLQKYFNNFDD